MTPNRTNEARFTAINVGCSQLSSFIVPTDFDRHNLLLINSLSTSKQIFPSERKVAHSKNRFRFVDSTLYKACSSNVTKKLLDGNVDVFDDLPQQWRRDIPPRMKRHGGTSPVWMSKLSVSSALAHLSKAETFQCPNDFARL